MNRNLFTSKSPGRLKEIRILNQEDWAFVPDDLPSRMKMPERIWKLLTMAQSELTRLDGVAMHIPNYELLLKPLQAREALKSSSLEGTYATPEELLLFEVGPRKKIQHDQINMPKEISNYRKSLRKGEQLLKEIPVSIRLMKELHGELLDGVRGSQKDPGNFRRTQVYIGSDRGFIPPPPDIALECLYRLETYIHAKNDIPPLILCFLTHYQFETIHPFGDGNGRTGRLLLSLMIFKLCGLARPWLYLSPFFDKHRDEYIRRLFNVSARGDWNSWLEFSLNATYHQSRDAINRFEKLVALRQEYLERVSNAKSIRVHAIIESLFNEEPIVSVPRIAKDFNVSYPTAQADIRLLVQHGILKRTHLKTRPQFYAAFDIMDISHEELDP